MSGRIGLLVCIAVTSLTSGCGDPEPASQAPEAAVFAGSDACAGCHAGEVKAWLGSHHDLAMQTAAPDTVLGDFSDATFDYFGTVTRFLKRDGQHIVQTVGEDGTAGEHRVKHTFGIEPLQQYLVELPGGRLQVLPYAWDTRAEGDGGQRWFHLYPQEQIAPRDPLFWTGHQQNWNYMCAECHSTQLKLGYDPSRDAFDTTWQEINVACEACHGPASLHVAQAQRGQFDAAHGLSVDLDDRGGTSWLMNPETGIAVRSEAPMAPPAQPEACGRCHSRRVVIAPEYAFGKPLTDTHLPALLEEPLYFPDGQIREEVFVYGSFLQSRMYRAGVTCSDCHDPHSLELVTGSDVNAVCAQCHLPTKFATFDHQRHAPGSAGCVNCHMPDRTYMVIDDRRDHSFRVPRPDLSETLGTPNACNDCHAERDATWAKARVAEWYGEAAFVRPEFATAIAAARTGHANAALRRVIESSAHAGIVRATALTLLDRPLSPDDITAIEESAVDPDPLMRIAAHRKLRDLSPGLQDRIGLAGLNDSVLGVRMAAVLAFAGRHDRLPAAAARHFRTAVNDYRAAYQYTSNRSESLARLGDLELAMGDAARAVEFYRQALEVEPSSALARANLADIHRARGDEAEAERILREGIALDPANAALHHSLGLLLVRIGRPDESLAALREATALDPENRRFAYVLGVALNSMGQGEAALTALESARQRFPNDFDIAWALATMYRDQGEVERALEVSEDLLKIHPEEPDVVGLHASLVKPN